MAGGAARRGCRRAGALLAVILLSLVAGELALRLFHHFRPSYVFESDSYQRYRGRPRAPNYHGSLNSWGFNDRERTVEKPAGVYRILALGDSFVFGVVPYEGNFVTLLEQRLRESGRPVELINLGIPRTSPEDQIKLLATEGLRLGADAALQFVYVGNDFSDLRVMRRRLTPYTLDLFRFLFGVLPKLEGTALHAPGGYQDAAPTFETEAFVGTVRRHLDVFDPGWAEFSWRLDRLASALRRTAALCRARDVSLAVVLLPAEIQVEPELAARIGKTGTLDLERPNRALHEVLGESGLPYLDLLPAFVDAAAEESLYKPNDTHWNLAGNRLAAERIYQWLDEGRSGLELPVADRR